ncbi:MAG: transporter [Oceanospirillum sp.]|nr:transporter [Oceanospirillum sp.]
MTSTAAQPRLDGLDFARFIAFFGMVLVNFRLVVSGDAPTDPHFLDGLITLMEGRAAATFVVLAGIGLGLAQLRTSLNTITVITLKRAAFLFLLGLLNLLVFDADILHYYAVFFLFGALLLPLRNAGLVLAIVLLNCLSVLLLFILDYDKGWNWSDYSYSDFWTLEGFVRHLFFNGWHPVIPWLSYLLFGVLLSRYDLAKQKTQCLLMLLGGIAVLEAEVASALLQPELAEIDPELALLATTEALPPMPLYMLAGLGSASFVIGLCLLLSRYMSRVSLLDRNLLAWFTSAGRQTLTLYLAHIFIGMAVLEELGYIGNESVVVAFSAAVLFCLFAMLYACIWGRYFKRGPLEALMRRLTG